jgi:hypothetical protein
MTAYRVYFVEESTCRVAGPPKVLECADDNEALQKARQLVDGKDVEVWEGPRLIARFPKSE